jgi:hypothetical protein
MTTRENREHSLKVCHTCGHWSPRYKGYCEVFQQGTGKFWRCLKWREAEPARDLDGAQPGLGPLPHEGTRNLLNR